MNITITTNMEPSFTKRFGKQVKALGGKYTDVRSSYTSTRSVTLPIKRASIDTIDAIVKEFGTLDSCNRRRKATFNDDNVMVVVEKRFQSAAGVNLYAPPPFIVLKSSPSPFRSAMRMFGNNIRIMIEAKLIVAPKPKEQQPFYVMLRVHSDVSPTRYGLEDGAIWHLAVKVIDASAGCHSVAVERNMGFDSLSVTGASGAEKGWVDRDDLMDGEGRIINALAIEQYVGALRKYRERLADWERRENARAARRTEAKKKGDQK